MAVVTYNSYPFLKYKRTVIPNNIFLALLNLRFEYILVIIRTGWCKITRASIYIFKKLSLINVIEI